MGPDQVLDKGLVAATAIPLYSVVAQSDVEECSVDGTAGSDWVGVCQEEVDADEVSRNRVVRVRVMGVSRCVASAAIALRARVAVTADGRVATATTGQEIVGIALTESTQAGEWINVQLTPGAGAAA